MANEGLFKFGIPYEKNIMIVVVTGIRGLPSEVIGPITGIFDRAVGTTAKVGAFYNKEQTQFPEAKTSLGLI